MKLTYATCQEILAKRETKKLANNTYLYQSGDVFCVKLHNTDVITINSDDTQTLRAAGYLTATTKDRLNTFSNASICQERGLWFVKSGDKKYAFFDGIKIDSTGDVVGDVQDVDDLIKKKKIVDKKVRDYIKGFADDVIENGLGTPEAGDCLICKIFGQNIRQIKSDQLEHVFAHIEEKYYVRSFLLMAIYAREYNNPPFIWAMLQREAENGKAEMLKDILVSYFKKHKHKLIQYIELENCLTDHR